MAPRVMFFTDSQEFGGAEQALLNLMAGLDPERWDKVLLCHPPGVENLVEGAMNLGVRIKLVPPMPLGVRGAWREISLAHEIQRQQPAVFQANLTWPLSCKFALFAAVQARVPVLVAVLHSFVEIPYSLFTRAQLRYIVNRLDRYITVSHDLKRKVEQTFSIQGEKIQVVHNGIEAEKYSSPAVHSGMLKPTYRDKRNIVLTVARLVEGKGLQDLLRAAVYVPEATFLLAGDGPLRNVLEDQARKLGVANRVRFLGYREDIDQLMSACDLFVLPSLNEGFPLSILEAMAAGRPVVASHTGGIGEAVVHGETGFLVPPADPECLAASMRSLLEDPQLAQKFGEAGRERVLRKFTVKRMIEKYASTYEALLRVKGAVYAA